MGAAKDVHCALNGPAAAIDGQNDDLDDAPAVWLYDPHVPQWAGAVLGGLQYYWHCDAVFYHRVGLALRESPCPGTTGG